ncbi:hypothetical protein DSM104299_00980 [Baekduia alba]|nr:hypothetical protein DSM104299_00980 [Baekduia alba]
MSRVQPKSHGDRTANTSLPELVTRQELAEIMRVSVPTIDRMRRAGMPHVTWGRRLVRFRVKDALAWAERQGATENGADLDLAPMRSRPLQ